MGDERDERVREGGKWDRESGTCEEGILEIFLVIIILLHYLQLFSFVIITS